MREMATLEEQFESHRPHLQAVAFRMLGSLADAEDAIQESWLRLSRADISDIQNLGGWLTTLVARICLDILRSRKARREDSLEAQDPALIEQKIGAIDPEAEHRLAEAVGLALMVVLQKLQPAERVAFVLHDMFELPFEQIGPIVGRSPGAARQIASRARRRVRARASDPDMPAGEQRKAVEAFLSALRHGDLDAVVSVLDPEVVLRADAAAEARGTPQRIEGAQAVARRFLERGGGLRLAMVNHEAALIVAPRGRLLFVFRVATRRGRIFEFEAIADPQRLATFDYAVFDD